MTVLAPPRHPMVQSALNDARTWCVGQIIDDRPALAHAVKVAVTIGAHVPDPETDLIAAALLHDSPDLAPPYIDLDRLLTTRYSATVRRIVRVMHDEHRSLDTDSPQIVVDDHQVLLASTADRIVALSSLMARARRSGDVTTFFARRRPLLQLLPHFHACCDASAGRVPDTMTAALGAALTRLDHVTDGIPR
ncbi:metal-dependent phosphohydrolase [Actinoplanes sp. Pm04-4]|uniref:Metal-dependent phosphohydrolase n=1 Tax=Paractinoplanes pyxinae TaxID=2997416 RepID=A0ABT4B4N9_9ACTN|nr:metal-dependent phosphohydrolase [Actinoplanes pyxinae]MCY1141474.1 metal-dependent phosphohydrolase [Actinoplanes pyxinae]